MTFLEFAQVMAKLESATGKHMPKDQAEIYFDMLSDLPLDVFLVAAQRALSEATYPGLPTIGTLRRLALASIQGERMTTGEVWADVMRRMGATDIDQTGPDKNGHDSKERAWLGVDPLVLRAVNCFGFMALYNLPDSSLETARAQFKVIYEGLAAKQDNTRLLPPKVQEQIEVIQRSGLPAKVAGLLEHIGSREK